MEEGFWGTIETNPEIRKIWMELGTGKKTSIDYFRPLSNPDQTSEERTFEEDIKMRADDVKMRDSKMKKEANLDKQELKLQSKRKKRFSIPIQATARSRKKYKMLGSLVAPGGHK